jgi:S-adenosylmethionine:tRNA ribosyltransferase-isomerase
MRVNDFAFNLPKKLIAQYPSVRRSSSCLLCLNRKSGSIAHRQFSELPNLLCSKDLLVFNDTRVIPARLFATKATGGKVEILIERILNKHHVLAHLKFSKAPKLGSKLILADNYVVEVLKRNKDLFELNFLSNEHILDILDKIGHIPLPPYIDRSDEAVDKERYQTVFAKHKGAVAAPTAGLHFDESLLAELKNKSIQTAFITLHVGAGTFQPIRVDKIEDHKMHVEYINVTEEVCEQIKITKQSGGRVIAVGTTVVRSLETAARTGTITPFSDETDIFIYPGFKFHCIDALITNFHLPKSTLIMLVSAFAGLDNIKHVYQEAIKQRYRFFSYGDAMFIL